MDFNPGNFEMMEQEPGLTLQKFNFYIPNFIFFFNKISQKKYGRQYKETNIKNCELQKFWGSKGKSKIFGQFWGDQESASSSLTFQVI